MVKRMQFLSLVLFLPMKKCKLLHNIVIIIRSVMPILSNGIFCLKMWSIQCHASSLQTNTHLVLMVKLSHEKAFDEVNLLFVSVQYGINNGSSDISSDTAVV